MLENLKLKVSAYCRDKDGRYYTKIDRKPFTKIEDIGSCIIVTHDRYHTTLIDKKEFQNFVFFS